MNYKLLFISCMIALLLITNVSAAQKALWNFNNNITTDTTGTYNFTSIGTTISQVTNGIQANGTRYSGSGVGMPGFTNNVSLRTNGEGSWTFWINLTGYSTSNDNNRIFGIDDSGFMNDTHFEINSSGGLYFEVQRDTSVRDYLYGKPLPLNSWEMVTVTWNATGTYLYTNTTLVRSNFTYKTYIQNTTTRPFFLGTSDVGMNFTMDNLGIYNTSLTLAEISNLYANYSSFFSISVSLISPPDTQLISTSSDFLASYQVTSTYAQNLTNATLYIWRQNGTIFNVSTKTLNGTSNSSNWTVSGFSTGNYRWNVNACTNNGTCSFATANFTFQSIPFSVTSSDFNPTTFETKRESYGLNITTIDNILAVTGNLWYNGSKYSATSSCSGVICSINRSIDVPTIAAGVDSENKSFFWEVILYDGSSALSKNTSMYGQNVSEISMNQCGSPGGGVANITTLNYTAYDEQNRSRIQAFDFQANFQYYLGQGTVYESFNVSNSTVNEMRICVDRNLTYFTDAIIAYQAYNSTVTYPLRNIFYQKYPLNNTQENVSLLLLKSTSSTSFILQVQDRSAQPVGNVLVNAQKCYPGDNTNITAFISRTDSNGLTVGNFEAETALYKFFITNQSNVLLAVTQCSKVVPQTAPYTLLFQLGSTYVSPFTNIDNASDITADLFYNTTTTMFTFTYVDTSGLFTVAELVVKSMNFTGIQQPTICTSNSSLPSGIIQCNVSTAGPYSVSGYIYRTDRTLVAQIYYTIQSFSSTVGYYGVFLGFFIILICAFMFKFNEIAGIWMVNIAVIFCNYVGLIAFGNIFITSMLCVSIILTAVLER